jgi:hypothetical protein
MTCLTALASALIFQAFSTAEGLGRTLTALILLEFRKHFHKLSPNTGDKSASDAVTKGCCAASGCYVIILSPSAGSQTILSNLFPFLCGPVLSLFSGMDTRSFDQQIFAPAGEHPGLGEMKQVTCGKRAPNAALLLRKTQSCCLQGGTPPLQGGIPCGARFPGWAAYGRSWDWSPRCVGRSGRCDSAPGAPHFRRAGCPLRVIEELLAGHGAVTLG